MSCGAIFLLHAPVSSVFFLSRNRNIRNYFVSLQKIAKTFSGRNGVDGITDTQRINMIN